MMLNYPTNMNSQDNMSNPGTKRKSIEPCTSNEGTSRKETIIKLTAFEQLKLLVWKNFVLQKRHKWQTVFEIASPVIFSTFLILVRCLVDPKLMPAMNYSPFSPTYVNITGRDLNVTSIKREGTLAFSPENPLLRAATVSAMKTVAEDNLGVLAMFLDASMLPSPRGFANAQEMEKELSKSDAMNSILVGVEFDDIMANATTWPDNIVVTLRFPAVMRNPVFDHPLRASWRTNLLYPVLPLPGPRAPEDRYGGKVPGYSAELFLAVQHALSKHIIKEKSGKNVDVPVYLQRLPQHPYKSDLLLLALERFMSMIIMLAFAYTFVNTVRVITAEKELQLKETMTIMGLQSWLHWAAWFIKQFSFLTISVILMVILFKIPFNRTVTGEGYAVLTFVPWSVLLFLMMIYIMASITFSFMISVFFSRANTAASFMGLAWLTTYSFFMLTQVLSEQTSPSTKLALSLISNTAMGYMFQMVIIAEGSSRGLQWEDFFKPISYHDELRPGYIVLMLILDSILYVLIAMYVEKVAPGAYGVPQPWYFPFTKDFWRPKHKRAEITNMRADADYDAALLNVVHDEEPKGAKMGVNIKNLHKVYGRKRAVDHLNLRMYENEITVLLGHNGAGKTTTISMMTGMVPPTSGTAIINGYNIVTETEQARSSLGICPQHNVLFPYLTVEEHIQFYGRLKGVPKNRLKEEVDNFVKLLELEDKRNTISMHLSGGQKRRLSVGTAMCGSSKVVLLDEPTSGLDPAARRALWDLLQKEKKGRTMVLTTHFMDEADVLGDRIAIMAGGRLQCVGTPYFLKKHYGTGYKLTIVKAADCDVEQVVQFFKNYVPNIEWNTNIGSELTFILTNDQVSKFPGMLKAFEEVRETLHVDSYGLSITSLEEVFMKAGVEESVSPPSSPRPSRKRFNFKLLRNKPNEMTVKTVSGSKAHRPINGNFVNARHSDNAVAPLTPQCDHTSDIDFTEIQKVRGQILLRNHIKAMFLKRYYSALRAKIIAFIQCVSPVMNIAITVMVARSWKFLTKLPPLPLNIDNNFRSLQTLISTANLQDTSTQAVMKAYKDHLKKLHLLNPHKTYLDIGNNDLGKYYLKLFSADPARVQYENLLGATFSDDGITAWFSNYGYHDPAISLSLVNEAILSSLVPNSTLTFVNHPLPYAIHHLVKVMATGSSIGFQFAFNISFCMAFVTAFLVIFTVKERASGAALLQRVSGVRPVVLWGCSYLWDWLWLAFVYLFVVIPLAFFGESTLSTFSELGRVYLVLIVFSIPAIPQHYLASLYFNAPATGFAKMCFLNMFLGCMPFLIVEVLKLPEVGSPYHANIFDWIFSPLPLYCVSRSFRDLSVSAFTILACNGICEQFQLANCTHETICRELKADVCCIEKDSYLGWNQPGVGRYLFMMAAVGVFLFIILMLIEYGVFKKLRRKDKNMRVPQRPLSEDSDVAAERVKVKSMKRTEITQHSLVCKDLTKYYKKFIAVNRISFAVYRGECFGLLGINGAGKTSTFRMLTGDTSISYGDAFVHGNSVKQQIRDVHRHIGYCPQFDALLDNLTARETLHIFCLLRGIPANVGAARANQLACSLGFTRHFDKKIVECSGGTKRKISAAVALLGDSPLIYLDEPTTGMDPASKRLVWSSVTKAVSAGRSVVLTSHSMEECEALCSRLTVMARGQLFCLGPLQHLKSKYSQGYTLIVKCNLGPDRDKDVEKINAYVIEQFRDSKLVETYLGISTYYLNDKQLPWWRLFDIMEKARTQLPIEDYSVSQTTLEQVFLNFTRHSADHESTTPTVTRWRTLNSIQISDNFNPIEN